MTNTATFAIVVGLLTFVCLLRWLTWHSKANLLTFIVLATISFAIVIILFAVTMIRPARAELCLAKIDNTIERRSGYRWQWRKVDGRKCWFYSNTLLPKEDLIWSYTSQEFDSDIDRVIERKFYFPEQQDK